MDMNIYDEHKIEGKRNANELHIFVNLLRY